MRYQVPQFIEVEDKIFGPLTIKQFIYLAGGGGLSFIAYTLLPLPIAILLIILIMGFSCALAFFKVNRRFPFVYMVEAATKYLFGSKLYIWRKVDPVRDAKTENEAAKAKEEKDAREYASIMVPKISNSKLKDLTWSLDIKESMYDNRNQR
ncbi:MAG: seg [Candidatus Taylorbacteria bacterium]|nr:seg [Candidatus Taylorbacteria bacterium]